MVFSEQTHPYSRSSVGLSFKIWQHSKNHRLHRLMSSFCWEIKNQTNAHTISPTHVKWEKEIKREKASHGTESLHRIVVGPLSVCLKERGREGMNLKKRKDLQFCLTSICFACIFVFKSSSLATRQHKKGGVKSLTGWVRKGLSGSWRWCW